MTEYLSLDLNRQFSSSSKPLLEFQKMREKNQSYDTAESEASVTITKKQRCACFTKVRGLVFMLLCVIFLDFGRFAMKNAFIESKNLTPMQHSFVKFAFMNILITLAAICARKLKQMLCSIPRFLLCRFIIRCFVFVTVNVLQCYGIKLLTYSTSVILSFMAPLLTPFTALIILGDRISLCNVISLLICFGGVIIFTNPSFFGEDEAAQAPGQKNSLIGVFLMLGSAVARAFDITLMKVLNSAHAQRGSKEYEDSHYVIHVIDANKHQNVELVYDIDSTSLNQFSVLYYVSIAGFLVCTLCFGVEQGVTTAHHALGISSGYILLLILASSVALLLSQLMYSLATKYEDVSKLASVFYFQIVLAFMWEAFVFKGDIGTAEILGTCIILVTSITVAVQKLLK